MRKLYVLRNDLAYKSLRREFEDTGIELLVAGMNLEAGVSHLNAVLVERGKARRGNLNEFLEHLEIQGLKRDIYITIYEANPRYTGYPFQEILAMDWDEDWKIRFEHPNYKNNDGFQKFGTLLRSLGYGAEVAHDILATGRFYIDKGE